MQRNCENEASSQLIKRKSTSTPSSDTGMAISKYAMLKTSRKERLPRTDNGHCQVEQTSREKLPDQSLVKHLEALSVQCVGIEIRISGGRYFDNVQMHYEKARIRVPATFGCYAEVSRLLLTMISLKVAALILSLIVSNKWIESRRPSILQFASFATRSRLLSILHGLTSLLS